MQANFILYHILVYNIGNVWKLWYLQPLLTSSGHNKKLSGQTEELLYADGRTRTGTDCSAWFWVIQAIRNLMAWTGIKRSFPSLSKTSKTRKSLIKSAFSTQSTKSTSNSSPPRLSAARYPIWGAGGMLEGCKQDIPPANSYRGHTH